MLSPSVVEIGRDQPERGNVHDYGKPGLVAHAAIVQAPALRSATANPLVAVFNHDSSIISPEIPHRRGS
jgi:hypothetical protein